MDGVGWMSWGLCLQRRAMIQFPTMFSSLLYLPAYDFFLASIRILQFIKFLVRCRERRLVQMDHGH